LKTHPEIQRQHRLSRVYLKKFGYQTDGEWMISVAKIGSKKTDNVKISEFTAEENIFDLPFEDYEFRRHFETSSGRLESDYNRLCNNIKNQKQITSRDKDLLNHFVPNILCRTSNFRGFIHKLIQDVETRKSLLEEITLFQGDKAETADLLDILKPEVHLNIVIGTLMNHLVFIFKRFNKVILKCPEDYGWLTTDNPVFIDFQNNDEWVLPIDSEIFFPLTKEYCLFMFNENSELNSNPLRKLNRDKVNKLEFETFENITSKISRNLDEYLIFYERYEPTIIAE
tara:strand:+ start:149 stop:1000 length:852 start_codon:yes stop_codon:yes gene_type:complete